MPSYDVIVIGGGHNGLTAATLLARAGRKVLVLERREALGGLAVGDEFHPGFTAAGLLHRTSEWRPHLVESLELTGLELTAEPSAVFASQHPDDGPGLLLHHDPTKATEEIEAHCGSDARRYGEYRALLRRFRPIVSGLLDTEPPDITAGAASLWSLAGRGLALRRLGRGDMTELLRIGPMCLADWLGEWFETELLRSVLAAPALAGTRSGPRSPGGVSNLLRLEALAGPSIRLGPAALVETLVAAARRAGVDIRPDAEVGRIRTTGGVVEGVELAGGELIDAGVVASSCDPKRTMLDLLGSAAITPKLGHQVDNLRALGSTAKVNLAIRGSLRFACRPELEIEHAYVGGSLDDLERAFDATKYGRSSVSPVLDVYVPSVANPGLAPADHQVVSIVAHYAPRDRRPEWTDAAREELGDAVVATLARHAPDVLERIVAREVLTPADIERRYGVTGGHVHHVEHALDQLVVRPVPACARYATPVRGLYLCGSGSHPGGGLTGGPGALAAAAMLRST